MEMEIILPLERNNMIQFKRKRDGGRVKWEWPTHDMVAPGNRTEEGKCSTEAPPIGYFMKQKYATRWGLYGYIA